MTEPEIEALGKPETWDEVFDDKTIAVLRLADAMCGPPEELGDELASAVRGHFDEAELAELILVAGQANLNNRVGNAAKLLLGP